VHVASIRTLSHAVIVSIRPDVDVPHCRRQDDAVEQEHTHDNWLNAEGKPAGGTARSVGLAIDWQDGATEGAHVETVLVIAAERLAFWQSNADTACAENGDAIFAIDRAIDALAARSARIAAESGGG
jgi:hypothetical protein